MKLNRLRLTRKQELALIELGFQKVLETLTNGNDGSVTIDKPKRVYPRNRKHKWTAEQRAKFSDTMRKKWAERKKLSKAK